MSLVVTCLDTETGETGSVTLEPGQFVVCCSEPAHVISDVAYRTGKNCVWVKRNRDEPVKTYKGPRGTCVACGRDFRLNGEGGVYAHDNPRQDGRKGWTGQCPGSRRAPRGAA